MQTDSNIRLAKNTLLLYGRMIITLIISLYTSRIVLNILGQDDYGIYNVIGGVVVLFGFLTNAMTSSTQRYLNYSLGCSDIQKVSDVFNTSIIAHYTIFIIVLFFSETIGLWFIINKLNIPDNRINAAIWVYQMSVVSSLISIIVIPYRASIIATEKMGTFAYLSVLEVILKLLVALALPFIPFDKLVVYSMLITLTSAIIFISYRSVCRKRLPFTHFNFVWNKEQYKEQMSFSGWYLFGGIVTVGAKQGPNIFLNLFYGVALNAAAGVANQVRNAIYGFATSFQTAFNPQIVKLYASSETRQLTQLIYRSSKFSFFLLYIISFPVILFCEEILSIWLVEVPQYSVVFTQLIIISSFFEAMSSPLWTTVGATGFVKKYQLIVSVILLLDIPLVYWALKCGCKPTSVFLIDLLVSVAAYVFRLIYTKRLIELDLIDYCKKVILPSLYVMLLSIPIPLMIKENISMTISSLFITLICVVIITGISIYIAGLNRQERCYFKDFIINNYLRR